MLYHFVHRFWGIVWTAGNDDKKTKEINWNSFWGIVWTAGIVNKWKYATADMGFWGIVWTAGLVFTKSFT